MALDPEIVEKIERLEEKYAAMGQDLKSYLDGLLYADYLTYWDYIHVDTLLSLQNPRTPIPDEEIFIIYHQITELYFKLSLHEMKQLSAAENLTAEELLMRMQRINRYFEALTQSFEIMVQGMDQKQFLQFRMSLLPASGFQSAQYRTIEILATDFHNLVEKDERSRFPGRGTPERVSEMYNYLYWKKGATELSTGKKTLTLRQFEEKYSQSFIQHGEQYFDTNLWRCFVGLNPEDQQQEKLRNAFRAFDVNVNVNWPLAHYKSAVRYLQKDPIDIAATGGTNWQKYLPPRFQKRIFYPQLWTEKEMDNWGKGWVKKAVFNQD
ncbi:MAG: tryptophan 2,3-dioxygenase family protein [Salibacteraceae bacterium]